MSIPHQKKKKSNQIKERNKKTLFRESPTILKILAKINKGEILNLNLCALRRNLKWVTDYYVSEWNII